ncbi:MAG: fibronectin type III domain-containing protein [Candidatus Thiodiazotropha sp.]
MVTIDSLTEDSTYTLSCSGSGGTAEDSVSVTVDTTALSVTLTADPTSVPTDGSTTLTWESVNADSCTASGDWSGSKDLSGTETIDGLTADSQFTLTCSDADGSASSSVDVTITTGNGTALLSWTPPTQNTDNSALTDLSGYVIYYGTASGSYTETVNIDNPGLTSYQIDNLSAADWYFVITAVNSSNVESAYSAEVSKTIN